MEFSKARMPLRVAAEALGCDQQTVRVLIQQGMVSWGQAVRMPGSTRYMYIISPKSFYEATGFLWEGR